MNWGDIKPGDKIVFHENYHGCKAGILVSGIEYIVGCVHNTGNLFLLCDELSSSARSRASRCEHGNFWCVSESFISNGLARIVKSNAGTEFRVGDRVRVKKMTVTGKVIVNNHTGLYRIITQDGIKFWVNEDEIELLAVSHNNNTRVHSNNNIKVKSTSIMSNIKRTLKSLARTEPERTFVKVGFMDECEEITAEGSAALQHILWQEHQDELKELADAILAEQEDN